MDVAQILEDSKKLTAKERAFIARYLISTLDDVIDEKVDQDWLELAQKRALEIENGDVEPISHKEFISRIRSKK